jgi:hypothetical protein
VKKPGACSCCRRNGQPCATFVPCCSGQAVCDGVCQGLPPDAPCTFDEQCTSNECTQGFCE